jgi:phospholipase D1/2
LASPNLIKKKGKPDYCLKDAHIHDVKAEATHLKAKVGKFFNIINPNHRHDEEHEQETDRKRSEIADSHRFKSFAPVHDGNRVKWYVDGKDYMWAVSEALEKATETIYIADWWLSPELFLRRPPVENQEWRLDQVLKRRAEAGVKIYIIVYKEVGILVFRIKRTTLISYVGQPSLDL